MGSRIISQMNLGKVSEPYDYTDSFIQILGYMRAYFHLPYRQTRGVVIAHPSKEVPDIPHYSTISRRINTALALKYLIVENGCATNGMLEKDI